MNFVFSAFVTNVTWVSLLGTAAAAPGLIATYSDGARKMVAVTATPHFTLGEKESIHPAIKPAFEASWTGKLKILEPGRFRFKPGAATLLLDGKAVGSDQVSLTPGQHSLRVEYKRPAGVARLQISWESESFGLEPLPASLLSHDSESSSVAAWARVDKGRALAEDFNCRGCHTDAQPQAKNARGRGPILSNAGGRLSASWIAKWLENPASYRANAHMPTMPLTAVERADVTTFLAGVVTRGYSESGSISEKETQADPNVLMKKGEALRDSLGCKACHGAGADLIDNKSVGSKMTVAALRAYLLAPDKTEPTGRMPSSLLTDDEAAALATFLGTKKNLAFEGAPPSGNAARGRALVSGSGCLGCHTLEIGGETLKNELLAPPFLALYAATKAGRGGCLAPKPPAKSPRFNFSENDRAALGSYLANGDVAPAPTVELERAFNFHRCRACHETDRPALLPWKDHAPSLADTGNKLRTPWVQDVVGGKTRMRHWMELRMPSFPQSVGARVAHGLAAQAGASAEDPPPPPKPDALTLRDGVSYLGRGEEGLACINCHDFAWYRSGAATPAPDLASMGRRMRPEWFGRWLRDPQRIQEGTQMPTYFADVEKGVVDRKVSGMWAALAMGREMPLPEGVTPDSGAVKLLVDKRPQIFRSFVTAGATRSVMVGLPGGVNYAFDLATCRLQFAWRGEFLDVRAVWMERGGQAAVPLGARFYVAPETLPLRIGTSNGAQAAKFVSYTLDKAGVPTFIYAVNGARVSERLTATAKNDGLLRSFEVKSPAGADIEFAPGAVTDVEITTGGGVWDGQRLRIKGAKGKTVKFTVTFTAKAAAHAQK